MKIEFDFALPHETLPPEGEVLLVVLVYAISNQSPWMRYDLATLEKVGDAKTLRWVTEAGEKYPYDSVVGWVEINAGKDQPPKAFQDSHPSWSMFD